MLKKFSLIIFTLISLSLASGAYAADLTGYAWSSNIGWISMGNGGKNYGVKLNNDRLVGYAWSSNIGWVNFNNIDFTGFARAIAAPSDGSSGWDGRIKLGNGTSYGVSQVGSNLNGFAWGDQVVGWVDFKRVSVSEESPICHARVRDGNDVIWSVTNFLGSQYTYGWIITDTSTGGTQTGTGNPFATDDLLDGVYSGSATVTDTVNGSTKHCSTTITIGGAPEDSEPTIESVAGKDRMEINSQPLSSPAISSSAQFKLAVPLSVGSATLRINHPAAGLSGADVTCRLARTPYDGSNPTQFIPCADPVRINESGSDLTLYLNTRVARPVQILRDHNPYTVTVAVDGCSSPNQCSAPVIFDYRVGTVNPI